MLIVFGGCKGCGEKVVQEWVEVLGDWKTWRKEIAGILVFQEKAERVKEAAEKGKWQIAVVADEDGKIAKALNAVFLPRAYGFVNGKLVWKQKEPNMGVVSVLESFLKVAKGEEKTVELFNAWSAEMRERAWGKGVAKLIGGREKR